MNRVSAALCGLFVAVSAPAIAAGPLDGTWVADMATAKLSQKPDTWVVSNGWFDCQTCTPALKVAADGKVHPVAGRDYYDAMSFTVVDPMTVKSAVYKGGKQVGSSTRTVSADGATFTSVSMSSNNAKGITTNSTSMMKRVAAGPAGSHAISGSWVPTVEGAKIAAENLTATIATTGDMVTLSLPTGETYTAKLDGPQVPFTGDTGATMVALTKSGNGFVETDYNKGTAKMRFTYMPVDATTATLKIEDLRAGTTDEYTLKKQ